MTFSRTRPEGGPEFRTRNLIRVAVAVLVVAGISGISSRAQQLTAEIKGTVADVTGSAVPEAQVTATNVQTGVAQTVPSKSDGSFEFLQLPVGVYSVTVVKQGFSKFAADRIQLVLNQTYTLPVTLQVGSLNSTVEVTANAVQVETSTTQLGTVIQSQTIVDLPLNGRNWVTLEQLAPGVVAGSDRFGTNYATNGSQSQQNSFLVNGADDIDLPLNSPSFIPSADAIAEFNLIDSSINPEYGRNSGGVLNAIIKSGTNEFHGDAFDFYRDTFLDSRNLYSIAKPVFHQNQFGGTLGGPIWKDHTFFFMSYQGTRNRQPETTASDTTTVFTAAQRNGDFGPGFVSSTNVSPFPLVGSNGVTYPAGTPYSTIFAGGTIPSADINPIAAKLLSTYVPLPNLGTNIYSFNPIQTNTVDQGIARLDHTFNEHDSMWVNLSFQHNQAPETIPFTGATVPGFGDESTESFKFFTADWTHTFSPTTLNELRVSYLRFNFVTVEPQTPTLPSSAGFAINPEDAAGAGLPFMTLTGYFNLGFSTNGPQPRIDSTYELADNLSKVAGKHTLKFGFEGKRYNVDNPFNGNNNGNYTFNGTGLYSTGDPAADFLLGIPDSYAQGSGGWIDAKTYEYYAYAQDNWKVTEKLTINYGAGYQIDTPLVNKHFGGEDVNCFIPGEQSSVFPTAPNSVLYPGDPGCTASGYHSHYDHIGPRFGFAYSPGGGSSPSWVIRGGFGVYFNRSEEELSLQNLGVPPFSITSIGAVNPTFANPFVNIATGAVTPNPFPFVAPAKGSSVNFAPYEPLSLNVISPNFTDPYSMNYNLNVQKQLSGSMLLQIGYVGSLGRHEELTYEGDPISPSFSAACATNSACIANAVNQQASSTGALSTIYSSLVPANVLASVGYQATDGNSEYNSMQVSLKKQLSHGLSFQASYTWAHSIDDTSSFENSGFGDRGIDPFNFAVDRGSSVYDARQRLVISYDYELPHLSRFWNNGLVRTVFDGWHVSGISTWQTGFPIDPTETDFKSLECSIYQFYGCWDAPNVVSSPQYLNPRNSSLVNTVTPNAPATAQNYYFFNPNTFSEEAIGQLGDAGRNSLRGPGLVNTDLSLSKRIYLSKSERRFLELRCEAYNVFNHTEFTIINYQNPGGVDGNINDQNFGRILTAYGETSGTSGQTGGRTIQLAAKFYF
jgi:hypothetical protein